MRYLWVIGALCWMGCSDDSSGNNEGGSAGAQASAGQAGDGGQGGSASGGAAGNSTAGSGGSSGAATSEHAVLVLGTLAAPDLAQAKQQHDPLAQGGESAAKGAGDIAHKVMLGTKLLGTTEHQFFAMDRWSSPANIDAFYSSPDFQQAFGKLFASPPTQAVFVLQNGWANFGGIQAGDKLTPHYWVVVRGKLKEADPDKAQAAHDGILSQVSPHPDDLAHVVFTGREDPQAFLAVDIWKSSENIETFYGNPSLAQAFGTLFEGAPSLGVYESTDWYQW